ncbi:MAG TPA: glycosyltransferase family 25 protein [Phycisphaerae bacterium]|nr:glycosyltransferase family 25 protein [Phycisphaerae bacterium]
MTLTLPTTSLFAQSFDRIYILNLPDRADRRRDMSAELQRANLPSPQPLDTANAHASFFPGQRVIELAGFPSLGCRGCFLSHLAILRHAHAHSYSQILILEDDMSFSPLVPQNDHLLAEITRDPTWQFAYFGHVLPTPPLSTSDHPITFDLSTQHVVCAHFYAVRSAILPQLIDWLETIQTRHPNHPDGGPMHVDGAFNEFRIRNRIPTRIAHPSLGHQRSSRSDIDTHKWFDRTPIIKQSVTLLRRLKNRLHQ